jgi:hypothetical protein
MSPYAPGLQDSRDVLFLSRPLIVPGGLEYKSDPPKLVGDSLSFAAMAPGQGYLFWVFHKGKNEDDSIHWDYWRENHQTTPYPSDTNQVMAKLFYESPDRSAFAVFDPTYNGKLGAVVIEGWCDDYRISIFSIEGKPLYIPEAWQAISKVVPSCKWVERLKRD